LDEEVKNKEFVLPRIWKEYRAYLERITANWSRLKYVLLPAYLYNLPYIPQC